MFFNKPITDEVRELNNKTNNFKLYFLVFFVMAFFMYFFTDLWQVLSIPSPEELIKNKIGINFAGLFDDDGNLDSNLGIKFTQSSSFSYDRERLIFFSLFSLAFGISYFLPVKYKKYGFLPFSMLILYLLYGFDTLLFFLGSHLLIYLVFHNKTKNLFPISFLCGFISSLACYSYFSYLENIVLFSVFCLISGLFFTLFYNYILLKLLEIKKVASFIRTLVIQSPMIVVCLGGLVQGFTNIEWQLPLGILLFFWQWERTIMYHIDFKDGLVPEQVSFPDYLTVFLCPSVISNWNYGAAISQGYAYTQDSFLAKDKNFLIIKGLKLWGISLFYLICGFAIATYSADLLEYLLGIPIYSNVINMNEDFIKDNSKFTFLSILLSTFLGQIRWFMMFGGVVHFKVGAWNMFGYNTDPYFDKPWLATNLVAFWARYTSHYRAFLVKAFYYPIFLNFFKKNIPLRVFTATLFATTFGNMIWGHITEYMFYDGLKFKNFIELLKVAPYFILLGLMISITQVYLLKRKTKRKPWTKDKRFALDILCAYATFQAYSLIHIFARPVENGTFYDYIRIFLFAFGIYF